MLPQFASRLLRRYFCRPLDPIPPLPPEPVHEHFAGSSTTFWEVDGLSFGIGVMQGQYSGTGMTATGSTLLASISVSRFD